MSPLAAAKTLVVKVGSSLVTAAGRGLDAAAIALWAEQIARLVAEGRRVILVSSGAIAEGMQRLGWTRRPQTMHELQAAAAVGQMGLVQCYESCFRSHGLHTAQVLLTHDDLECALSELSRVTRDRLILADPVANGPLTGRVLWLIDRGSYRRTATELRSAVDRHFDVEHVGRLTLLHRFVLISARVRQRAAV